MKWFKNLDAVSKLMVGFGVILLISLPLGYLAMAQISQLSELNRQIFERDVAGMEAIKQAELDQALMGHAFSSAVLAESNSAVVGSAEHDFQSLSAEIRTSLNSAYSRSIRANLRDQLQTALATVPNAEAAAQDFFSRAKTNDRVATDAALKAALLAADQMRQTVHRAAVIKDANIEIFKTGEAQILRQAHNRFLLLLFAILTLNLLVCLAIGRSFSKPLNYAASVLGHVERGDLTQRLNINTKDEIGRLAKALNAALSNVSEVIREVGDASRNLTSVSAELAESADLMAGGAQEQAASLEQTSASLEQITATVRQNSDNARQASQFAISSRDAAEKGGSVVQSAMGAMKEINEASTKIAAIIRAIDDIAFQTNLLAVNASVEAARAREHGKGFAVVATEVRTLAQRSGVAAKEIKSLISDSRQKVEKGSTLVNRSGQTLTDIVVSVKRVTDIVSEIASASREQSTGIEQVNGAMLQMDKVMQSNSSQTEELSATANMLASRAKQLEQLIGRFVVTATGPSTQIEERSIQLFEAPSAARREPASQLDPASTTTASLAALAANGLAANPGQPVSSIAALDAEFEEF
jgi:methyl-accepting chemotaxis protein